MLPESITLDVVTPDKRLLAMAVDEVVLPEEIRPALGLLLRAALQNPGPHLGPFQIGQLGAGAPGAMTPP